MKLFKLIAPVAAVFAAIPGGALAIILLSVAETPAGRFFAVAALTGLLGIVMVCFSAPDAFRRQRRALRRLGLLHLAAAAGLLAVCGAAAPEEFAGDDSALRSEWIDGEKSGAGGLFGRLIPEVDQALVTLWLLPYTDSTVTPERVAELETELEEIYRDMESQPEFASAECALGESYGPALGFGSPPRHLFAYTPASRAGRQVPVLLVLHDRLGNLKASLWLWKRFADRFGFAIVAPTLSDSEWSSAAGSDAVDAALRYIQRRGDFDGENVTFVGLGGGARGVPRFVLEFPKAFRRLVFISPQMDSERIQSPEFREFWRGKPILILHGSQDVREPLASVERDIDSLRRNGVDARLEVIPDEDHFLFFTKSGQVIDAIERWIEEDR